MADWSGTGEFRKNCQVKGCFVGMRGKAAGSLGSGTHQVGDDPPVIACQHTQVERLSNGEQSRRY